MNILKRIYNFQWEFGDKIYRINWVVVISYIIIGVFAYFYG